MTTLDLMEETFSALFVNKVRSGLTVLGIVIGIGSVIAMIAIGQGAQGAIQSNIQSLGSNLVMVMPGFQRGPGVQISQGRGSATSLTQDDADAIAAEIPEAKLVSPELSGRYQVTAKGTNTNTQVLGVVPAYPEVRNVKIGSGDFITEQHQKSASKVAVLGPTVVTDLFGEGVDPVGQTIRIKRMDFKVVGVTQAKGGSGFNNQDDVIFVPLATAQRFLAGNDRVSTIAVQATDAAAMAPLQESISALLMDRHKIVDPAQADFNVLNQADIVATASSIANTFTILLGSVAGISLIVGGIGIMNMMLTTVTERTREIGLRKAIGGKRRDINLQFLAEATLLTFVGGIMGVLLGWLIAVIISRFGGIATKVSPSSVLLAFGVSAAIGIIFGYYPARRAGGLNPIEALRYE
ncbi:MAG TPA: ABC transporter permease [Candidatus Eisenbacteria bacterium]|jgi:putative ABC transport system permease protein|nr:ABC transporter permease [Candidatus Eisenbacteria bacterium]